MGGEGVEGEAFGEVIVQMDAVEIMASRYDIPIIRISRYRDLAIVHCRSTLQNEAITRRTDVLEKRKSNGVVDGVSYDGGRRNGRVRQVTIKRIRSFDGRASGADWPSSHTNESAEPLSQDHTAGKTGKQSPSAYVTESLNLEPPEIGGGRGQGEENDGETNETKDQRVPGWKRSNGFFCNASMSVTNLEAIQGKQPVLRERCDNLVALTGLGRGG